MSGYEDVPVVIAKDADLDANGNSPQDTQINFPAFEMREEAERLAEALEHLPSTYHTRFSAERLASFREKYPKGEVNHAD